MRYWKRVNAEGLTTTVESYSHDQAVEGAVEINQAEYDTYIAALPPPPPPTDWKAQFAAAKTLEEKLTIMAKKLGLADPSP